MNYYIFIFLAAFSINLTGQVSEPTTIQYDSIGYQGTAKDTRKKFEFGLAGTFSATSFEFGSSVKLNYIFRNKHRVGITAIVARDKRFYKDLNHREYTVKYRDPGHVFNLSLIHYGYTKPKKSESKFDSHVIVGLAYENSKMTESRYATDGSWSTDKTSTYNTLSGLFGVEANYKIGPGKIYLELIDVISIYGTKIDRYENQTGYIKEAPIQKSTMKLIYADNFLFHAYLNLGYKWSF